MFLASQRRPGAWLDALINILAVLAGGCLCALTALICVDVAARYFRWFAMPWSLDVAEYTLLLVTFLGAPWVLVRGGHISIDIVVERLSPRPRRRMTLVSHSLGAVVCAVLLVFSARAWWSSYSQGTTVHETFVYPEWLLFAVPPPIFLMLLLVFIRWLFHPPDFAAGDDSATDGL